MSQSHALKMIVLAQSTGKCAFPITPEPVSLKIGYVLIFSETIRVPMKGLLRATEWVAACHWKGRCVPPLALVSGVADPCNRLLKLTNYFHAGILADTCCHVCILQSLLLHPISWQLNSNVGIKHPTVFIRNIYWTCKIIILCENVTSFLYYCTFLVHRDCCGRE